MDSTLHTFASFPAASDQMLSIVRWQIRVRVSVFKKDWKAMVSSNLRTALVAAATLIASASTSRAQVDLTTYTDAKGYLNVRALTCAQLANTYQEDANFLGAWYSGWWNGHMKRHSINIARAKEGLHEVIVYCKANPDKKVVDAVDAFVKKVQQGGQ
jgi:hypothetical protein